MSEYVRVVNPSSPLRGRKGRVLGYHRGDYIEVSIAPGEYPYVLKREEVSKNKGRLKRWK